MVYQIVSVCVSMKINDPVHLYEGEWFNEGRIIAMGPSGIDVDFLDWVQRFQKNELTVSYIYYQEILVVSGSGEIIEDFRS